MWLTRAIRARGEKHPSSVTKALNIQEIVDRIVYYVGQPRYLASTARVCKRWHEPSVDLLWAGVEPPSSETYQFDWDTPFFEILGELALNPGRFKHYFKRVRDLDLSLARWEPHHLPEGRESLQWQEKYLQQVLAESGSYDWMSYAKLHVKSSGMHIVSPTLISMFFHPKIVDVDLCEADVDAEVLRELVARCPNIHRLRLGGWLEADEKTRVREGLTEACLRLARLSSLGLVRSWPELLNPQLILQLSDMVDLKSIVLDTIKPSNFLTDKDLLSSKTKFANLRQICFHGAMPNDFRIWLPHMAGLEDFHYQARRDIYRATHLSDDEWVHTADDILACLASCPQLKTVDLLYDRPHTVTLAALITLAQACHDLQRLWIEGDKLEADIDQIEEDQGAIDADGMLQFARLVPNLQFLRLPEIIDLALDDVMNLLTICPDLDRVFLRTDIDFSRWVGRSIRTTWDDGMSLPDLIDTELLRSMLPTYDSRQQRRLERAEGANRAMTAARATLEGRHTAPRA